MSKGPWLKKRVKVEDSKNKKMVLEARAWARDSESYWNANKRSLDKIVTEESILNLLRDVAKLKKIENIHDNIEPDKAPKIPCPICNSKDFLVEGWSHRKILVCERPTCTYMRAMARRGRPELKVVNQ